MKENRKNTTNVPNLRFPEFEGVWKNMFLSDLLTFKNGLNASKENYGSGYKFINVLDIINNDFINHNSIIGSVNVSEADFQKNIVEYGDILFQRSSETREEVGQANIYLDEETPATFGGFVIRGKKKSDYNPIFLNYLLKTASARKEITSKSGGSTRFNVGQETLSSVGIITATIPEQTKIASFISKIEARIKTQSKIIEDYILLKKAMVQKIFKQELRFKDEHSNNFPEWEEKKLGEVLSYEQPTKYLVSDSEYSDDYNTPVLTAGKTFLLGYTNEIEGIFKEGLPTIIFDDFTTAFQYVDFPFKAKSSAMKMLIPANKEVNIKFVFEVMTTIKFTLSEHKRYWISEYQHVKIPYPCLAEQQKIASTLYAIDRKIELETECLDKLNAQKQYLLQNLFI